VYKQRYLLAKIRTTWGKASDSGRTRETKTVSDVFRHRSGIGKSYCRTRFDVGSERVNVFDVMSWNICCVIYDKVLFKEMWQQLPLLGVGVRG
jgi:hypothetical protein